MHYKSAGYKKLSEFEKGQSASKGQQLADFLNVILSKKIYAALKKKDWKSFAKLYYGPGSKRRKEARKFDKIHKALRKQRKSGN